MVFESLEDREQACEFFQKRNTVQNRQNLVPFRLTGNVEWGVPAPEKDGVKGLLSGYGLNPCGLLYPLPNISGDAGQRSGRVERLVVLTGCPGFPIYRRG